MAEQESIKINADESYQKLVGELEQRLLEPGVFTLTKNLADFSNSEIFPQICDDQKLAMVSAVRGVIDGESELNLQLLNQILFEPKFIVDDPDLHQACTDRHVELYKEEAKKLVESFERVDFQVITSGMFSGKSTLLMLSRQIMVDAGYETIDLVAGVMPEGFIHARPFKEKIPAKRFVREIPELKKGETKEDFLTIDGLIESLQSKEGKLLINLSEFSFLDRELFYEFSRRISELNENREIKIKVLAEGLEASFCDAPLIDPDTLSYLGFQQHKCKSFSSNQINWVKELRYPQIRNLKPLGEKTIRYFQYSEDRYVIDMSLLNVVVSKYADPVVRYNTALPGESVSALLKHDSLLLNIIQKAWEGDDEKRDELTREVNANVIIPES